MHKITKNILRIWITISALILFAIGWITLAHAEKPAPFAGQTASQIINNNPMVETVELAPVPSLDDLTQTNNQSLFSQSTVNINIPRLRTRGS